MDFLKKVGSTAESLLEQVDQKTAEISKDVRSGNREARRVAERLEKRERILPTSATNDADIAKKIMKMQEDLDAAGEVLLRSQQLSAERESRLTTLLENERLDREKREEELLNRIKELDRSAKEKDELEHIIDELHDELEATKAELEDARGSRDQDTVELQAQAEQARASAEQARAALAATIKDSEARIAELERTNLEFIRELQQVRNGDNFPSKGDTSAVIEEERMQRIKEIQELEEKLIATEDRRSSLEMQLTAERVRGERLESSLNKATSALGDAREEYEKKLTTMEAKMAGYKREAEEVRLQMENMQRSNADNGRDALEKRLESLSAHVELKQRQIDSLRSEKSALEQRLAESSTIHTGLRVRASTPNMPADSGRNSNRVARLRIDPIRHKELAKAVDILDRFSISAGKIMRSNALVRLGFLAYILLLHIWVFHVITWSSTPPAQQPLPQVASASLLRGSQV